MTSPRPPAMSPASAAAPEPEAPSRRERFVFLLLERFTLIAFAGAVEPLRLANRMSGRTLYEWQVVSDGGGPVRASNGVVVEAGGGARRARPRRHDRRRRRPRREGGDHQGGADLAAPRGAARARHRRGLHRGAGDGRGGAARRPALHHPLGEPRRLRGGLPRHRADPQRLRHRPRPLHRRRRRRLDRPDAGADRAPARGGARQPRRRPDDPHRDPLRPRRAAAVDPDADRGAAPEARRR